MANTLMFEVGIKRANEEYNKILEEIKGLAKMADKPVSVKLQLEKTEDLKTFLNALKQLGDGKMLEPMLHRIDTLQASLVRLGMVPKDINYSALEKQLQNVTKAYENYQKAREKAGLKEGQADVAGPTAALGQAYRLARTNLEKEFGMSEQVARATMDTFKNMGQTIQENMARIGGSKAGMDSLSGEVGGLVTKVDALVNAFGSLVTQLKSLGSSNGVKEVAVDVSKADEGTTKMAQALAKAFGTLAEKKNEAGASEESFAAATNAATGSLKAEEAQAAATAQSILKVSEAIAVTTLATKNLYTILGGNREDVARFLELANQMDMLSRKAAYILSSGETFKGGKMGAFGEVQKEMAAVQAQMDELKKSGMSGSPIIDSFATAFTNLANVLNVTGASVKESTANLKKLGEGTTNIGKIVGDNVKVNVPQSSYKQLGDVIKELGVKYDLTADKVKKLNELIESGNLTTGNVQRKLKIGFNQATDIVDSINAVQKNITSNDQLTASEQKAATGAKEQNEAIQKLLASTQELTTATTNLKNAIGSWGQDKGTIATMIAQFDSLRVKITEVVAQWEKLAMVKVTGVQNVQVPSVNVDLSGVEPAIKALNEAVAQLKKSMDLLWESTDRMNTAMKGIVTPESIKKIESDAATAKQKVDELSKSVEGMKTQAEKKGSETTLNANLDVLRNHTQKVYEALSKMGTEYSKLEAAGIRDEATKTRIENLRAYYEWLQKVATMQDVLSKPGALKADATKFNGELLMGQVTKQMWSDKAVKDFAGMVDEALKGKQAFDSLNEAMGRVNAKLLGFGTSAEGSMKGVGAAMETINKVGELNIQTLIKEQAQIERMMKIANGSIKFSEGHPVAGMEQLEKVQRDNLQYLQTLNRWINLILENRANPDVIRFLNTPQSLRLPLPGRQDDVAMFNAHYDKLKHSITDTSAAARQLAKDMSMSDANATTKQWNTNRLENGLYRVQDAIQNIMKAWRLASQYGDEEMAKGVAAQINQLNAIKQQILSAMTDDKLLSTRHGYAQILNPSAEHTVKESRTMVSELNAFRREREKSEKEYNKNVERWQESQMKEFARQEQEKAKAATQAQKEIQKEIQKTEAELRKLNSAISRGNATPGRDMSILSDARSKLQGQLSLLQKTTPADLQNSKLIEKRIQDIRTLRSDTDELRKSEERLTTAQQQANKRNDKADDKKLKDEIKSVNDAYLKYNELGAKINELLNLKQRGIDANVDVTKVSNYIAYLEKIKSLMADIYGNGGRTSNSQVVQDFGLRRGMLATEALAHNNVKGETFFGKQELAEFKKELSDAEKRMNSAAKTSDNLVTRISKLGLVRVDFAKAGLDTTALDNAIGKIHVIQQELANFARTGYSSYGNNAKDIVRSMGLDAANKAATDAVKQLNTAQKESVNAANQMTAEQQRLAQALNHTTESARGQSQVLSDLKMLATQYLSVWGAQSFLNNIIEIGGQLEMQRLSIGAILGDTAHANDLFDKIKAQAIQSPFGVVELDQMTKQLSAYGFQYNELFDMTKRLADISAATGTSVDRLALALGHVRSEAALSGYTLRQFSMANIPLAKKLSEHLTEVEKRFVSVADVRKRVSKKEIGYEDVVNVLKDLTNEGGMFYNMQETISQSVKARFKNLHDALDIMFGDIAESSSGDALKGLAKTLTEMTTHWREFFAIAKNVGIVFGAYKLAVIGYNVALGQNNAAILKNMLAYKQKRAAELQNEAMVRKLTDKELKLIQTRKKITAANIQVALSTNAVTRGEVLKMVALRNVNLEEAKALIRMGEFTAAEIRMALQGKILGMNLGRTGAIINLFGQQLGAATKALFLSPQTWIFALIAGFTELWQMNKEEVERAKEMSDDLYNRSNEGIKNTRKMFEETDVTYKVKVDGKEVDATDQFGEIKGGRFESPKFNEIDTATAMSLMDKWEKYIKEYAAMPNHLINEAYKDGDKVRELADQYDLLRSKMIQVAEAQHLLKDASDAIQYAEDATNGGWFNDSLTTNINDYAKAVRNFNDSVSDLIRKHEKSVGSTLKAARADKTFNNALTELKISTTDYAGQIKELIRNQDKYPAAYQKALSSIYNLPHDEYDAMHGMFFNTGLFDSKGVHEWNNEVNDAKETMMKDISTWVESMKQKLSEAWNIKDFSKMTEGQKQAVVAAIAETVSKASQGTDAIRTEVKNLMQEKFGIEIDDNTADVAARIAGLKNSLKDLIGRDWHINVGTNFEDTYGNIKKAYKAAKSYLDSTKPLQMKLAIDVSGGMNELGVTKRTSIVNKWRQENPGKDSTWLEEYLADYDDHARKMNEALDFSKKTGLSLEDEKKKNGRGAGEDKEAKRLREIAKLYKDAYDWYNKYEKQIGEGGALSKVQSQFQPLFDEFNKTWKTNLTLDSIPKYKKNLESLLDEAMKLYKSPKHKNSYMVSAIKELRDAISNVEYEEAQRKMDEYASKVQIQLDNLTRSWDIFNSVREATNDAALASQLSGANYQNGMNQNLADALKHKIEQDFNNAGGKFALDFDINLSDEDIQKLIENTQRFDVTDIANYQEHIKGLVDEYKKWRDLQRDVYKNDISVFAKLTANTMTYEGKLKKINDEYQKQLTSLENLRNLYKAGAKDSEGNRLGITEQQYLDAKKQLDANTEWETFKIGSDYISFMNGFLGKTQQIVADTAKAIEQKLGKALKERVIDAKTYADQMRKVRDLQDKFREDSFYGVQNSVTAFMQGGLKGSNDFVKERIQQLESIDESKRTAEQQKELDHYKSLQEKLSKAIGGLSSFAMVLQIAQGVLDGFAGAAQSLATMFEALGNMGAANFWSDVSDGIKAGASVLAPVNNIVSNALSGNIGGVVSSAISAPIDLFAGPITAFAKLHDKRRERQIQALKEEVSRIANNTELILKARARTLGYDTGEVRQSYAQAYAPNQARIAAVQQMKGITGAILRNTRYGRGFDSAAQEAMYNYYQENNGGNGYQQQLANLRSEREKYMQMYNEEEDKKNTSQAALDEYKAKIAELDDQIHYFAMDLANELWSIDLKGWAQQLSDALANAFENGTDMAKAYKETVTNILQTLASKMLQLAVIEPMMEKLQNKLFGTKQADGTWNGGVFNIDDPVGSAKKVTDVITDWFGKNGQGQQAITAAQQFLTAFEQGVNNAGLSIKNTDQKTLSNGISEVTEETANLLAGYVNALRQDVAINRILLTQFITEYWGSYIDQITSMNTHLANIDNNVAAMAAMFRETGQIYGMIENISDRLDRFATGFDKITVQ